MRERKLTPVGLMRDTETIIEAQIEPKLVDAFGLQVANSLLTRATLCYVAVDGDEKQRYAAFVRSICSDERVVDAWGAVEAAGQEQAWRNLIGDEPHAERAVTRREIRDDR
jgi:hypothetical protein